jgi:4,5-dihydroxyphthalate decarboxylase
MTDTGLTLALDRYDRHFPFFDGSLPVPDGLELTVLQVGEATRLRDGTHRHARMLRDGEFGAAEVSLSSYLMAIARGMPFTAIPVFPRRLFSPTQMFVNASSGITSPEQLAGRRVGLQSFQTTLAVLAKGDLAFEYGVDLASVKWMVRQGETIDFVPGGNYDIESIPADADLGALLAAGHMDALFFSRVPESPEPGRIRRLFADAGAESKRYYRKCGFFPIMHVLALRNDVADAAPELPRRLMGLYERAKIISGGYFEDPGWSQLPWGRLAWEEQTEALGGDGWPVGLAANRANLERFISYSYSQGLIDRALAPEDLFHPSVLQT